MDKTLEEKKMIMSKFCAKQVACTECEVHRYNPNHSCSSSHSFTRDISDEEVYRSYEAIKEYLPFSDFFTEEKDKRVFIINGGAGVGKDTFIDCLRKKYKIRSCSSIDPIKNLAKNIGWDEVKNERGRKLLSDLKDALATYSDRPFRYLLKEYDDYVKNDYNNKLLFIHIREPKEIERARVAFNAFTILVKRDSAVKVTSNHADAGVENYDYDFVIYNNGSVSDLEDTATKFLRDLGFIS